jgi:acetyl/propionyl-CoA carboxylase alpha subunit
VFPATTFTTGAPAVDPPGVADGGVRVDTHVQAGAPVPPYYDSLLAKVIGHGRDRAHALAVLRGALDQCVIDGVSTNLGLQRTLLADSGFAAGGVDTGYLARWLAAGRGSGETRGASREPGGPAGRSHRAGTGQAEVVRDTPDPGPDHKASGDG